METIPNAISWLAANWGVLVGAATSIIGGFAVRAGGVEWQHGRVRLGPQVRPAFDSDNTDTFATFTMTLYP